METIGVITNIHDESPTYTMVYGFLVDWLTVHNGCTKIGLQNYYKTVYFTHLAKL